MIMRVTQLLFLLTTNVVVSIKVFSFNSTEDNGQFSSAILTQSPAKPLPDRFITCFAMKEDKTDRNPLHIRGESGKPWIAFRIWNLVGRIALWIEVGKKEVKMFHVLPRPWKFWRHICADIDTLSGNVTASVDGTPSVTNKFNTLSKEKPRSFNLEIGWTETLVAWGGNRSYRGQVSNVNFYLTDGSLDTEALSKKPCDAQGNILAWSDMVFDIDGENVFELNETDRDVCAVQPKFYDVLLPGKMDWDEANHLCKAIGSGKMTEVENESDLETIASKMGQILASCPKLWLPLSDEKREGFWENTNEGREASLLKWADGQPNGLRDQNHAALFMETLEFGDFAAGASHCVSCKLSTKAVLTLRGVCKHSYLGKKSETSNRAL